MGPGAPPGSSAPESQGARPAAWGPWGKVGGASGRPGRVAYLPAGADLFLGPSSLSLPGFSGAATAKAGGAPLPPGLAGGQEPAATGTGLGSGPEAAVTPRSLTAGQGAGGGGPLSIYGRGGGSPFPCAERRPWGPCWAPSAGPGSEDKGVNSSEPQVPHLGRGCRLLRSQGALPPEGWRGVLARPPPPWDTDPQGSPSTGLGCGVSEL